MGREAVSQTREELENGVRWTSAPPVSSFAWKVLLEITFRFLWRRLGHLADKEVGDGGGEEENLFH